MKLKQTITKIHRETRHKNAPYSLQNQFLTEIFYFKFALQAVLAKLVTDPIDFGSLPNKILHHLRDAMQTV